MTIGGPMDLALRHPRRSSKSADHPPRLPPPRQTALARGSSRAVCTPVRTPVQFRTNNPQAIPYKYVARQGLPGRSSARRPRGLFRADTHNSVGGDNSKHISGRSGPRNGRRRATLPELEPPFRQDVRTPGARRGRGVDSLALESGLGHVLESSPRASRASRWSGSPVVISC